jgi:DNA-binding response OmpR family regulator
MMKILIVEDGEHLARLVAEVLGREGYVAQRAFDGRAAELSLEIERSPIPTVSFVCHSAA